jgi:DNA polymerase-1
MKKLFLLDAFALIYRAYFAFSKNPLVNSKGWNVSAIQGFCNTLVDLLTKENPSHIAVCFDTASPTERHTDFAEYKANRQEQPEDITFAVPYIKAILKAMHIPVLELPGYEADDIIGTIAKQAVQHDYKVFMVTPDKDFGQLVEEKIFIYKPPYMGNTFEILGTEEIKNKWEIDDVCKVIDILGLMGDAIDNIPGLPGVGEKTAKKLVAEFGSVENLLNNSDKLKGKLKETVEQNKELAILSKKLATIITNAPIEWNEEMLKRKEADKEALAEIFRELEFRTLGKKLIGNEYAITDNVKSSTNENSTKQTNLFGEVLPDEPHSHIKEVAGRSIENTEHHYILCDSESLIQELLNYLTHTRTICFDTETTGIDANNAELVGLSFCIKANEAWYVPLPATRTDCLNLLYRFKPILEDENKQIIGQNIKYDMLILKWYGLDIKGKLFDTMIAHYLLEPDMRHGMDFLSETYLGYKPIAIETLIGKGKKQLSMRDIDPAKVCDYAAEDADITMQLKNYFEPLLISQQSDKLFYEVEVPLIHVLRDMEYEGVRIDDIFLSDYSKQLQLEIEQTEKNIFELAGVRFNIASPKQLGEVLYDKLKIPYTGKKTATGQYSTDEDTLLKQKENHPIIEQLLNYRELTKLKSTYVDAIPALINPKTGRVHTSFNQAVAATGRLSSTDPNLQNIPIRTERGRQMRKAFIARDTEHLILSADYSQIELRIIAALSGDENMLDAFYKKQDIHAATASRVFGVSIDDVTRDMRGKAKAVNFGIAYGQTAFGLSQTLGISKTEAAEIIENYNQKFPGVKKLMEQNIAFAREHGYTQTVLGRRRYLRDINSRNATIRGFAERNAINAPIQGTAADMIKVAMIRIHDEIKKRKLKSCMTLQVHDELVFDAHQSELSELKPLIEHHMQNALQLNVPIEVGMGIGTNWLDAH